MPEPTENGRSSAHLLGDVREAGTIRDEARTGLAGVLRGLSALFWGLPLALLAFARHFLAVLPTLYDLALPTVAAGLVFLGLVRLGDFQRRERIWQGSLLTSQVLALLVVGLSPFLFLWSRAPSVDFFGRSVLLLLAVALVFLVALMRTLERLAAMLPDETLHGDTRLFRGLTAYLVSVLIGVSATLYWRMAPGRLSEFLEIPRQPLGLGRQAILLLLILIPVAMAMAVTWKLKEVVLALATGAAPPPPPAVGNPRSAAGNPGISGTGSRSG